MYNFAKMYNGLLFTILPRFKSQSHPGNKPLLYEMINVNLSFSARDISVYSSLESKTFPITFALAEFLWIMGGHEKLQLHPLLKPLEKYAENGKLFGAYGPRLETQLSPLIDKLLKDPDTRQAFAPITRHYDITANTKDLPCNVSIQFLIRDHKLNIIITSRSSDIMTGLPIDSFHWQLLLHLILNTLNLLKFAPYYEPGIIYYNIGSLHMYLHDYEVFKQMHEHEHKHEHDYSHILNTESSYYKVRDLSKDYFEHIHSLQDMKNIIIFKNPNTLDLLEQLFVNRINKIDRKNL
jgi:thymidylate synthase